MPETAQIGQTILFVLTLLLSAMLMSQLIEEKSNKIVEVIAAAVPIDAMFVGKLFAMLAASIVGMSSGSGCGALLIQLVKTAGSPTLPSAGRRLAGFLALRCLYFAHELSAAWRGFPDDRRAGLDRARSADAVDASDVRARYCCSASRPGGRLPIRPRRLRRRRIPAVLADGDDCARRRGPEIWPHVAGIAWQAAVGRGHSPVRRPAIPQDRAEIGPAPGR